MNKKTFVLTFTIFSFIFALTACSNIGGEYSESAKGSAILLQAGMGRICGSIDGDGASSKSVVPDTSSILSTGIDRYVVYAWGTKADGTVVPSSSPIPGTVANDMSFGMELEYGTWNIRADALDASGKVLLSKTSETMPISESVPVVNLSLSLNFLNDASQPGSLALPLSYSTSVNIAKIDYSLTPSSGAAITGTVTDVSSGSLTLDASLNASFGSLAPGTYSLLVKFLDSDGGTIIRLDQAVQIYSNLTTKKIDGNAPYVSGGSISITSEVVSQYQSSVIYVGGTGLASGAAASDTNNGSQYDPVASLSRALNVINNSSLTPADGFTVYLQDNISLSSGLRITASKKIAFVGTNSSSHYKISAGGNYISKETAALIKFSYIDFDYVNNFELTDGETQFTNCNITNGSSSSNGGGFSVLQSGTKAVLQNCTISDCSASEGLGGGIYVAADSGTAEVQLTNCVIGAASPGTNATDTENSNFATSGGGIFVASGGKVTLNNSKVNYNYSSGTNGGGGICSSGTLILTNGSNVGYNASSSSGGGISLLEGVFNSEASSIIYNKALGSSGAGGGLNVANSVSQFKMFGDTIAYNYANNGGGLSTNTTQSAAAQFEGVLLQNNEAANNGGAIQVTTGHYLTLASCDINTNRAHKYGGGVYCAGTVTMNGTSSISMNTSDSHGGGVYNNKTFKMQAGQIVQNNCRGGEDSYQYGGGIYNAKGASLTIDGGTIGQNNSNRYGGGIYSLGNITMTDGLITANKIDGAANKMLGGANIYIQGYSSTSPVTLEMSAGEIANVSLGTMSTSFSGSVMMGQYSTFNMSGGKISNNDTKGYTAGVYLSAASATFNMTGGSIEKNTATLTLGTPEYGGAIYSIGTVKLSGAASIPAGDADGNTGQGKNDVFLSGVPITITDTLSATAPVATITPSVYSDTTKVLDGTSALLAANYEKFGLTDDPSGGVWAIGNLGVLYQTVEQGGTITIDTPEGALTIAASATEITTSDTDTTITLSAENASGTDVTGDLTWALSIYYGSDTTAIATRAANSYNFLTTFPKGTYVMNVSVVYNGTTYSDNFTITKTVDAGD